MLSFGSLRALGSGSLISYKWEYHHEGNESSNSPSAVKVAGGPAAATTPATGLLQHECGYYDVEQVQRVSKALLLTLARVCVERSGSSHAAGELVMRSNHLINNSSGGGGTSPNGSAMRMEGEIKREMLEYLQQQSEAYASGSGALSNSPGMTTVVNPAKVVDDILESFVRSKRTLFTRVMSSKIMCSSEKKDDKKFGDFVQELERTGTWILGRREVIAKAILKRVDRSKAHHCAMRFDNRDELAYHKLRCTLRPISCHNPNCGDVFSAIHAEAHDASCPFKILHCRLKCEATVSRSNMDNHCATVCPMKPVSCPFHHVSCSASMPQGEVEKHCEDNMGQHLLLLLNSMQDHKLSINNQSQRILLVEKAMSVAQRADTGDTGWVQSALREHENRLNSLEEQVKKLQQEVKATDVSAEVLQLRRELRNIQRQNKTTP
ncbi:unnamed protein product [Sphagnum jensenii]|uniref:TRAF-type domain-containing protein n=1 Tax=Sphagnum jensenii TaxID=128206 RepID=A0ABP0XC61_9BRYO